MDLSKYFAVLVVFLVDGGESGGHGGKHHGHVRLHVPEFIHHDHHTKVITIHHHHHSPKKEHHHHHHHHHKPHIPYGHHYHRHVKKVHKKTESSDHHGHHGHQGHHGHHGHIHKHHAHHGHHGHHGHHHHDAPSYYPQHDTPSIAYDPPQTTFEEDFAPHYSPSGSNYGAGFIPQTPQVHGVTHTVKQVKVFDSLPGAIPSVTNGHAGGGDGYQVTEEGEEEDDAFTSIDGLQQSYPATFGYVRNAAPEVVSNDLFSSLAPQSTVQSAHHDPFAESPTPSAFSGSGGEFTSPAQVPISSLAPTQNVFPSAQATPEFPVSFQAEQSGFDDPANAFAGVHAGSTALSPEDKAVNDIVSYSRVAGIQQTINTGGVETLVY